jgi:sodium-dependent dicarboxylate transporter 2/3/5
MPLSSDSFEDPAARMNRMRRTIGLFLGPALFVVVLLLPTELNPQAHRLAAVFALVIVFWISEAIPLAATALLGPALAVVLGVAPAKQAFALFGHPIIFLFLGSFLIAGAMRTHGLDRRIALFALSRRWVGDHPGRILLAFGAIAAFLSMWMSNTATTAMMLPIGLGVLATLSHDRASELPGHWPYATGLMLMIAYSCNVGGIGTPVGSPPNLIAIGMIEEIVGRTITFFEWMSFGVPIGIVLFVFLYFTISRLFRVKHESFAGASDVIRAHRAELGPWNAGQKAALVAFLSAVTLWTLPGFAGLALGHEHPFAEALRNHLAEGPSAIIAATLLFVIPIDWRARRFALNWRDAVKIDWGTILLFGGGLSLGSLAFSTGLAEALGQRILQVSGGLPVWAVALLALFLADFTTEIMSNTATANLLIPMFLALGGEATGNPVLTALAATLGCSLAFCLPVATPPNAIVYGSGHVSLTAMIRTGILLDIGCGLLAWAGLMLLFD